MQTHDEDGIGTTVGEEVVMDEVDVEHGPTDVETLGDEVDGPTGGYLDLQPDGEQDLPGQEFEQ